MTQATWNDWIKQGNAPRRRLVIQTINALRLSYRWDGLETALRNFQTAGLTPQGSPEAIKQAADLCGRLNWDAKAIRADFR